jgi:hypothetical protein
MLFVDEPYISDFLRQTIQENQLPVVNTPSTQKMGLWPGTRLLSESEAVQEARRTDDLRLLATSENSIGWIAQHLAFTGYPRQIELFKNKAKFRKLTRSLYPGFFFKEVRLEDLDKVPYADLPPSFIIKPTVGFFSMGVHKVSSAAGWQETIKAIHAEIEQVQGLYPHEVLDIGSFIIEEVIDGAEFAIDAYFDAAGQPVILDILSHIFSSEADVSDRVYTTSKEIIEANLAEFTAFLAQIGQVTGARNFPVHVELRRTRGGTLIPIEVNPLRFGGWCSTPDLAYKAYGINPYLYYFNQQKPDWQELLKGKRANFSAWSCSKTPRQTRRRNSRFDFDRLLARFEIPLELRPIDYHAYPVFAFLFVETRAENFAELNYILNSDLREFIHLR